MDVAIWEELSPWYWVFAKNTIIDYSLLICFRKHKANGKNKKANNEKTINYYNFSRLVDKKDKKYMRK